MSYLFINLEQGARRFTLRKTVTSVSGVNTSLHVETLSANLQKSLVLAYDIAKELGLDLRYDPKNGFPADLDAVYQAKKDARQNKKSAKQQAAADRQSAFDQARQQRRDASEKLLNEGIYSFGKYIDQTIESQPGYAQWLVEKKADFTKGSILEYAVGVIESKYQHLLVKTEIYIAGHRPEKEGSRIKIRGTVQRRLSFCGAYGTVHMVFIKDENGFCIVSKGSWYAEAGAVVDVTAMIKAKETYKGQDQTVVNRVKG